MFLVCAGLGLLLEVLFTALSGGLRGDKGLRGYTTLWVAPVYGAVGWSLGELAPLLVFGQVPLLLRALLYLLLVYAAELGSGLALRRFLGRCPWEYTTGHHFRGLVRLDYAPYWLLLVLAFERWLTSA